MLDHGDLALAIHREDLHPFGHLDPVEVGDLMAVGQPHVLRGHAQPGPPVEQFLPR